MSRRRRAQRQRPAAEGRRKRPILDAPTTLPALERFRAWPFVALTVVVAAIIRLLATRGDLWLDEIWTIRLTSELTSPLGILTELRHDNNHVLNTIFVYLLRPLDADWAYRLPAWIAGVATVGLAAWVAWIGDGEPSGQSDGPPGLRAVLGALLFGGSYLLVHYGTEARGYALSLCFGLLALGLALRDGVTPWSRRAPLYWLALVLALLGQALAIHLFSALVVWSTWHVVRRRAGLRTSVTTLGWWQGVPTLAYVAFYVGFLRVMTIGGGPREGAFAPLGRAVAYAAGFPLPSNGTGALLVAVAVAVLVTGIVWLARRGSDLWLLHAVGIAGSPAALLLLHPTDMYFERYFLVSVALWLLLVARMLAALATRSRAGMAACALVVLGFLAGNGPRIDHLLRDQRGHYRDALRYIADHSARDQITLTSDHDFRNRMVVGYFAPRLGVGKRISYVARKKVPPSGIDWYLAHGFPDGKPPAPIVADASRTRYHLEATFTSGPLSGWNWYVYRRLDGAARSPPDAARP